MNRLELFEVWAPPHSLWSPWAKPALFAEMPLIAPPGPVVEWPKWTGPTDAHSAIVLDLPGADSVKTGLALARAGYRPVPLFNAVYHTAGVINLDRIVEGIIRGAKELAQLAIAPDAPPVFLLDALRQKAERVPAPGRFDNRWIVFPQDFPSGSFLQRHGIHRVCLFQPGSSPQPQSDLAHVLLRWQDAEVELWAGVPDPGTPAQPLRVSRPSGFGSLWYRALTMARLRRSSAGGFGSIVPRPSSG